MYWRGSTLSGSASNSSTVMSCSVVCILGPQGVLEGYISLTPLRRAGYSPAGGPELRRAAPRIRGLLTPLARATARDRIMWGEADALANRRGWCAPCNAQRE